MGGTGQPYRCDVNNSKAPNPGPIKTLNSRSEASTTIYSMWLLTYGYGGGEARDKGEREKGAERMQERLTE